MPATCRPAVLPFTLSCPQGDKRKPCLHPLDWNSRTLPHCGNQLANTSFVAEIEPLNAEPLLAHSTSPGNWAQWLHAAGAHGVLVNLPENPWPALSSGYAEDCAELLRQLG